MEPTKPTYWKGDLFENIAKLKKDIIITHVCNDIGAWGSGFVVPLERTFPKAAQAYRDLHKERRGTGQTLRLGEIQLVSVAENRQVANMIAQHEVGGPPRPIRYNALATCMDRVSDFVGGNEIHCPMFGASLAGGNWLFIEELIQDCWIGEGHKVFVHYLPQFLPAGFDPETMRNCK